MAGLSSPKIHMMGSIPLKHAESVFRKLASELGDYVERIPDGETGHRVRWVSFIWDQLMGHPDFEVDPNIPTYKFIQWDGKAIFEIDRLRFKQGVASQSIKFSTGYAVDALSNYELFSKLKSEERFTDRVLSHDSGTLTPVARVYNRYKYEIPVREAMRKMEKYILRIVEKSGVTE